MYKVYKQAVARQSLLMISPIKAAAPGIKQAYVERYYLKACNNLSIKWLLQWAAVIYRRM